MNWNAHRYHDDRCWGYQDNDKAITLYLFEGALNIPIEDVHRLDEPDYIAAAKQLASQHDHVFIVPDEQVTDERIKEFRRQREPYVFELHSGRYDKKGECLDTDPGYISLEIVDNWYLRQHPDRGPIFAPYISYDWHLTELEKARQSVKDDVGGTVADALDRALKGKAAKRSIAEIDDTQERLDQLQQQIDRRLQSLDEMDSLLSDEFPSIELADVKPEPLVYFIRDISHTGYIKIGMARNIHTRYPTLRLEGTKGPVAHQYQIVHVIYTSAPATLEGTLHRLFASQRRHGEWFALTPEDIQAAEEKFGNLNRQRQQQAQGD